jgi:uncharacterized protein YqfA (UPF0365 family)
LRQVLVRLLPERLTVEPNGRGWRVTGRTVLGPLIATRVAGMALPAQHVDSHTWLAGLSVSFEALDPG